MRLIVAFSLIVYSGLGLVWGRPNGAPVNPRTCVNMIPGHFNRASGRPEDSGYTVDTVGHGRTYTPGVIMRGICFILYVGYLILKSELFFEYLRGWSKSLNEPVSYLVAP